MSGHSKWANIKRDKGVNDAKKSKEFTKVSRLIAVAARQGGGDSDSNSTLRLALEKAREARMPRENIERAIKRGLGQSAEGNDLLEVIYEGFGPGGEAFLIKAITDNKNRTVAEIRSIFSRAGGSLGGAGSTQYIFFPDPSKPAFTVPVERDGKVNKLSLMLEELHDHDDVQEVFVNFNL